MTPNIHVSIFFPGTIVGCMAESVAEDAMSINNDEARYDEKGT